MDEASKVAITYTEGDLPENTTLNVDVKDNLKVEGLKNTVGYDITLMHDGKPVQPKNPVTVSIEPQKPMDRSILNVFHETQEGFESLAWTASENDVIFETASFSLFALGEKDSKSLPSTGVTPQNLLPIVGALLVAGACFVAYGKRKENK